MEKKLVIISFVVLAFLAVGGGTSGVYYYSKYQKELLKVKDPQGEAKALLVQLGKLMDLPKDEQPTVETVTNADQIKDRPFFAKAKNGDRVIIYTNARMAILFDSIAGKIMNVGTLSVATSSGVNQSTFPSPAPNFK